MSNPHLENDTQAPVLRLSVPTAGFEDGPSGLGGGDGRDSPPRCAAGTAAADRINLVGELASGMAHDFRNVLAVIQSALNLIERNIDDPSAAGPLIEAARGAVARGTALTTGLLALARPRASDVHAEDLLVAIGALAPFLRYAAGPKVKLVLDLPERLPSCRVDPAQFNSALLNLVVNARDAMPDGGEIRIGAALVPRAGASGGGAQLLPWLRVSVCDDGAGMPQDVLDHIFEPWFTTKGESGTGLGLPQVADMLRTAGGRIEVRSHPGDGTIFDLYFPVLAAGSDPTPPRRISRPAGGAGAPRRRRAGR